MRHTGLFAFFLGSVAVGVACTNGPSGPAGEPINEADSQVVGQAVGSSVAFRTQLFHLQSILSAGDTSFAPIAMGTTGTPTPTPSPTASQSPSPSPSPTASPTPIPSPSPIPTQEPTPIPTPGGNTADLDGDGIPENATYGYDGATADTTFGTTETDGSFSASDGNPGAADGSYSAAFHLEVDIVSNAPWDWSDALIVLDGNLVVAAAAGTSYTMTSTVTTDYDITRAAGRQIIAETSQYVVTYTPAAAWTPGLALVPGSAALNGAVHLDVDGRIADANVVTEVPLEVDPGCRQLITGGVLAISYSGGGENHFVRAVWAGCNAVVIAYDSVLVQ